MYRLSAYYIRNYSRYNFFLMKTEHTVKPPKEIILRFCFKETNTAGCKVFIRNRNCTF